MEAISEVVKQTKGFDPDNLKPQETLLKDLRDDPTVVIDSMINFFAHNITLIDIKGLKYFVD